MPTAVVSGELPTCSRTRPPLAPLMTRSLPLPK
jgi:hypothetical protein